MVVNWPLVRSSGEAAEVAREVAEATPKTGVTKVGEVLTTKVVPVPVWAAIDVALPTEVMGPVKLALVVTLPAVKPAAVPVRLVATPDAGVPKAGATNVLLLKVAALVLKTKVSDTLAKSGIVKVVAPMV